MEVRCSRCGTTDDLHLIAALLAGPDLPGRVLVYCPTCRDEKAHLIDVDVPLAEVDVAFFVKLYRDGKTDSSPSTAAEIVFGEPLAAAVKGAEEALAARGRRQA